MLRSCGCIVNDLLDRKFGRKFVQSANVSTNANNVNMMMKKMALPVLFSHAVLGLLTLFSLSPASVATSTAAIPIAVCYLFMKRYAWPAQITLGMYTNWGVFVGYAAILNRVDWEICLPVYAAAIVWTLLSNTLHAHRGSDLYNSTIKSDDNNNDYNDRRRQTFEINSSALWLAQHKDIL